MAASNRAAVARLLLGAVLATALATGVVASPRVETGKVVWVADGDTITVRLESGKEKVRLVGIDTPELDDHRIAWRELAYAARAYARKRVLGRTVALERDGLTRDRDRYGRLLRYVVLDDGTDFNEEMIREGYARDDTRCPFTRAGRYAAAEKEARAAGRGRWGAALREESPPRRP